MTNVFQRSVLSVLPQALCTGKYSDLKIVCQGEEFSVHRIIVCGHSQVLAAAVDGYFQETSTQCVKIEEFNVLTVTKMINFMYSGDYIFDEDKPAGEGESDAREPDCGIEGDEMKSAAKLDTHSPQQEALSKVAFTEGSNLLVENVRVNAIADYYDVPKLAELARTKIQVLLDDHWEAKHFPMALHEAYHSTSDRTLRQMMTSAASSQLESIVPVPEFAALGDISDCSFDIINKLVDRMETLQLELTDAHNTIRSIDNCVDVLAGKRSCENRICTGKFECNIKCSQGPGRFEWNYTLYCWKCNREHNE